MREGSRIRLASSCWIMSRDIPSADSRNGYVWCFCSDRLITTQHVPERVWCILSPSADLRNGYVCALAPIDIITLHDVKKAFDSIQALGKDTKQNNRQLQRYAVRQTQWGKTSRHDAEAQHTIIPSKYRNTPKYNTYPRIDTVRTHHMKGMCRETHKNKDALSRVYHNLYFFCIRCHSSSLDKKRQIEALLYSTSAHRIFARCSFPVFVPFICSLLHVSWNAGYGDGYQHACKKVLPSSSDTRTNNEGNERWKTRVVLISSSSGSCFSHKVS